MCPKDAFDVAANGLNFFLSQFPHMDEEQLEKIEGVIRHYAQPEIKHGRICRQALRCSVGPDGSLLISPHFIKPLQDGEVASVAQHIENSP